MKKHAFCLLALITLGGAAYAAGAGPNTVAKDMPTPGVARLGSMVMSDTTTCPAPYTKYSQGVDASKGESYCVKSDATCPEGYSSNRNQQNGQLTCTPKAAVPAPDGWSPGFGTGVLVFNSVPQPLVKCPKSTPDWQWGTTYYKEGWNKMGCRANIKPAY